MVMIDENIVVVIVIVFVCVGFKKVLMEDIVEVVGVLW